MQISLKTLGPKGLFMTSYTLNINFIFSNMQVITNVSIVSLT